MTKPSISIILPNYNGEKYLERTLHSFCDQGLEQKELIVVDDKSSDSSHSILQSWSEEHKNILWIREADKGISDAINIGIKHSSGDMIGYLGSDDVLMDNILVKVSEVSSKIDFDYAFFNSYTYYIKERKCILQKPMLQNFTFNDLLKYGTIVGLQNTFFRKSVFDEILFNPENKYSMDYEMLLEMTARNYFGVYVDEVATINIFDDNISNGNLYQSVEAAKVAEKFASRFNYNDEVWGQQLLNPNIKLNLIKYLNKFLRG